MFLIDSVLDGSEQDLIYTASDLVTAATCEYQLLRKLDEKLGRSPKAVFETDEMLMRTAVLGDAHEHRVLQEFRDRFGTGVVEIEETPSYTRPDLTAKHQESIAALESGADVVFQASFFDGAFHGRSDFLVKRHDDDGRVRYAVYDTKLARRAKVTALLQLAAYGDQLARAGIPTSSTVTLVLGSGAHCDHSLTDLLPAFEERRARFRDITMRHRSQPETVSWGDPSYAACGRCEYCAEQVQAHRDLLLVAKMTTARRRKLMDAGITTIDDFAARALPPGESGNRTVAKLRDQARMQTGAEPPDGSVTFTDKHGEPRTIGYKLLEQNALALLPRPSAGDIFFDFEGDPLWQDEAGLWGLEYLFGVVENPAVPGGRPPFRPFWAHSRAQEGRALAGFLVYVAGRRRQYPDLRIYHYANYEKAALRRLSLQHAIGEDAVDELLREGILVDLYDTVRHSLLISEHSYSIKKLEPLYMGENLRTGDVTDAAASVVAYAQYCEARDAGRADEAAEILAGISDYNEYDCVSTLELRNWLLKLAAERGIVPGAASTREGTAQELAAGQGAGPGPGESDGAVSGTGAWENGRDASAPEELRLRAHITAASERAAAAGEPLSADDQAIAMVAAAVGYHRREDKKFWWDHFDRLNSDTADWADTRDVFTVESGAVVSDWERPTTRRNPVRTLRLTGTLAPGSVLKPDTKFFLMYDMPFPRHLREKDEGVNYRSGTFGTEFLELDAAADKDVILVRERLPKGAEPYPDLPMALTPDQPRRTTSIRQALAELATAVASTLPSLPPQPALDLLRRIPPRLSGPDGLPPVPPGPDGYIDAITAAVERLDHSYLAVQGPPGTGKTYVGSHVVARLVERGWKVGIVAQSHAVVENMLRAAIENAGMPPDRVAKRLKDDDAEVPWPHRTDEDVARLIGDDGGCLVGGTAWTMTGARVPARSLDLLIIDEAGQFSLANTMAVSRAASRLLLLGDPQQLPQVSQGTHPESMDQSALGWLSGGHATLPPELGYFLAQSWRMHPDLCRAVSVLSYDGRLESAPAAVRRFLQGPPAGVECVELDHHGNSTSSEEEATEVVHQVRRHLGLSWAEHDDLARPLAEGDLLVVAPYNAQVQLIRRHLDAAGLNGVRVGTVDKIQGQEAPVVIVSTAVSAVAEAPRGMEFVLNRNRNNVAVSRAQWRAVIVRSRELTHYLPTRPEGLEELGAFIGLCQRSR